MKESGNVEYTKLDQTGEKMSKEQKIYTKEFKLEAVRLAETSGKPITEIARDLGVSDSAIHNWRKQFSEHGEQAFPGSGHQTPEAEELRASNESWKS